MALFRGTNQPFKGRKVPLDRIRPPSNTRVRGTARSDRSLVPQIGMPPQMAKAIQTLLAAYPKRMIEGRKKLLLAAAGILRDAVQRRAPALGTVPYAEQLRIALLEGVDAGEGVAVYFEGQQEGLKEDQVDKVLLFVVPRNNAPAYVQVLANYNPWPPGILPMRPQENEATLIARAARPDEVSYYLAERGRQRDVIESALRLAGVNHPTVAPPGDGVGAEVHRDVAWAVLRAEFGLDGKGGQGAHWRPALQDLGKAIPRLMRAYVAYVETGVWAGDSLPEHEALGMTELGQGADAFTRRIAPFAPKRKFS